MITRLSAPRSIGRARCLRPRHTSGNGLDSVASMSVLRPLRKVAGRRPALRHGPPGTAVYSPEAWHPTGRARARQPRSDPQRGGQRARAVPRPPARGAGGDRRRHAALPGCDGGPAGGRQAAAASILLLGLAGRGRRGLPGDLHRGSVAGAAAGQRARARRRHGRQRHPAGQASRAPAVRQPVRRRGSPARPVPADQLAGPDRRSSSALGPRS